MDGASLALVQKNCRVELAGLVPRVLSGSVKQRDMMFLCGLYRRAGIADLLMRGVPDGFARALSRSARMFHFFLGTRQDGDKRTSLSEPFFDAVAGADDDAAAGIARASRATWSAGEEYEDDFLYYRLVMQLFLGADRPELSALTARYGEVLEGAEDTRLDVCAAVAAADQAAFDGGFDRLIQERVTTFGEKVRSERLSPDAVATDARVSVEILALARIAARRGLATRAEYPLAPAPARLAKLKGKPDPEAWRNPRAD